MGARCCSVSTHLTLIAGVCSRWSVSLPRKGTLCRGCCQVCRSTGLSHAVQNLLFPDPGRAPCRKEGSCCHLVERCSLSGLSIPCSGRVAEQPTGSSLLHHLPKAMETKLTPLLCLGTPVWGWVAQLKPSTLFLPSAAELHTYACNFPTHTKMGPQPIHNLLPQHTTGNSRLVLKHLY